MRPLAVVVAALTTVALVLPGCAGAPDDGPGAGGGGVGPAAAEAAAPEAGILPGTLTALEGVAGHALPLSAAHARLAVTLVLVSNLPQTSIGMNVSGPDGRSDEARTAPLLYVLPGMTPTVSFQTPGVGEWTAAIELRSGASADYEVHWCADEPSRPGPPDNLACHRDYGGA